MRASRAHRHPVALPADPGRGSSTVTENSTPQKKIWRTKSAGFARGYDALDVQEGNAQRLPLKALGQALQLALWTYASIIFLSVLPCFGLRVLQEPSGDDLRALALLENRGTRQVG